MPLSTNIIANKVGVDNEVPFANSALINTQINVDIIKPLDTKERYGVTIYNPSTVTDLTVKMFLKEVSLGGSTRYALLDTFTVPKSQTVSGTTVNTYFKLIEGAFLATDVRFVVSNNTALGTTEGFSAYVRVREGM